MVTGLKNNYVHAKNLSSSVVPSYRTRLLLGRPLYIHTLSCVHQMAYAGVTPPYTCLTDDVTTVNSVNLTDNVCSVNGSACTSYVFHSRDVTAVSQWSLLCERRVLRNTITSAQMGGVLVGNLLAGQVGSTISSISSLLL